MLCVQRCSDARPAGRVRCLQVQSQEPKTGQQKVQLYFAHLGILFIYRISKQYFLGILFLFLVYDLSIGFQTVISWYIISFLGLLFIYKISKQYFLDQRRHLSTSFPVPSSLWAGDVLGKLLGDKPGRAGPRNKTI